MAGGAGGGPPPGWYPDPERREGRRWWDGTRWSDHVAPPSGPPGGWSGTSGGYGSLPSGGTVDPWLWQSIVATLLCCLPAGIVGIVFASQAQTALSAGDPPLAAQKAAQARTWTIVAVALGLAWVPFFLFAVVGLAP